MMASCFGRLKASSSWSPALVVSSQRDKAGDRPTNSRPVQTSGEHVYLHEMRGPTPPEGQVWDRTTRGSASTKLAMKFSDRWNAQVRDRARCESQDLGLKITINQSDKTEMREIVAEMCLHYTYPLFLERRCKHGCLY